MSNPHPVKQWTKETVPKSPGRPKRAWTWAGLIEEYAEKMVGKGKEKQKDAVVSAVFEKARKGDVTAAKELWNRTDGMPTQETKHFGEIKTTPNISFPALIAIAEEYETRILEELKKTNSQ